MSGIIYEDIIFIYFIMRNIIYDNIIFILLYGLLYLS